MLGDPIGPQFPALAGGMGQHYTHGSIYYSPGSGAHEVHGAIHDMWSQLGWERGFLGFPLTDEMVTVDGLARYSQFQGGSVYWSPGTGAHEVHGAILDYYLANGAERSFIGLPTADETSALGGRVSTFSGADLWWSGPTGTHEVQGDIRQFYRSNLWLGLPTTDEIAVTAGRASFFRNGRVYWSPATGTHEVHGDILAYYVSLGAERGSLGLPISDEHDVNGGRESNFQHGTITWSPETGARLAGSGITVTGLAAGAPSYSNGASTTLRATVTASPPATVPIEIIVRDSADNNLDFSLHRLSLSGSATTMTETRVFQPGQYRVWVAYINSSGQWVDLAPETRFTVQPSAPTPAPPPPTTGTPAPVGPAGSWQLRFQDEFSGNAVDWTKWADHSTAEGDAGQGNLGNQQLEWNQGKNCSVSNGTLKVTAKPDNITSPSGQHYNWSSCLLTSSPGYTFQSGYIEVRAKFPAPTGFWPSFWTWQAAGNNNWNETDVYEFFSDNHALIYMHQNQGTSGGCEGMQIGFDPTTDFHVYGADIQADGTDFYIDGVKRCHASGSPAGPMNLIIDNFVYSHNQPVPGSSGVHEVDYVRAWKH